MILHLKILHLMILYLMILHLKILHLMILHLMIFTDDSLLGEYELFLNDRTNVAGPFIVLQNH